MRLCIYIQLNACNASVEHVYAIRKCSIRPAYLGEFEICAEKENSGMRQCTGGLGYRLNINKHNHPFIEPNIVID